MDAGRRCKHPGSVEGLCFIVQSLRGQRMSIFLYRFSAIGQRTPVLVGGCVTGEEPSGCLKFTMSSQRPGLSLSSKAVHYMNILGKKSRTKADSASAHSGVQRCERPVRNS